MGESDVKYQRVQDSLRRRILTGQLQASCMIPSERELMSEYKVSRQTVRGALSTLEADGLIVRRQGRGTIVSFPNTDADQRKSLSREIGVVAAGLNENYSMPLIKAVETCAAREGYSILISNRPDGFGSNMDNILDMLRKNVAGLLIFPLIDHVQNQTYRFLSNTGVPFIFVDMLVQCVDADCVTTDNFQGAYDGTRKLIESGCRRIAYIGISMAAWTSRERLSGYQKAIWDAGLEVDRSLIFEGYYEQPYLEAALSKAAAQRPAVDGIFFANHPLTEIAFAVMTRKTFPEMTGMAFCSFDAPPPPKDFTGPVISVRQPASAIGETAARLLLEHIEKHNKGIIQHQPPLHIKIPPTVVDLSNP